MKKITCIALSLCFFTAHPSTHAPRAAKNIWVIIHGTFSKNSSWHVQGGDFHSALRTALPAHAQLHSFVWSGKNSDEARSQAGKECAQFLQKVAHPNDRIYLIGHSHGGNVAILAAAALAQQQSPLKINTLITLGTPVCTRTYLPDMNQIGTVYNLFSYGDRIQPVLQLFGRVYPDHKRIHNIQVQYGNFCPTHRELHSTLMARHLPHLHKLMVNKKGPLRAHLFEKKAPEVILDAQRERDIEIDKRFTAQMLTSFSESRYGKRFKPSIHNITSRTASKIRTLRFWNWRSVNAQPTHRTTDSRIHLCCRHGLSALWRKNS